MTTNLTFAGDRSLLVEFGKEPTEEIRLRVSRLTSILIGNPSHGILNVHPAYTSVLVSFDPLKVSPTDAKQLLEGYLNDLGSVALPEARTVEIPVCYGGEFGPDLEDVATINKLSADEVIKIHSSGNYRVSFLGFSPGFPYLEGLPKEIATPRLETPRISIPAGSVGIAGNQTGIYPSSTPGGWRIIGRSPMRLFNPDKDPPTLLRMGDKVKFVSVNLDDSVKFKLKPGEC